MKLQIGTWEADYVAVQTTAPEAYDGFGTINLYQSGEDRIVAVDTRHLQWQVARYASGMHAGVEMSNEDTFMRDTLIKRLQLSNN